MSWLIELLAYLIGVDQAHPVFIYSIVIFNEFITKITILDKNV